MLEIKHLSKTYKTKHNEVYALKDINLSIQDKGMVFILGKSGSGKSTLLNVLGGLDSFDEGEISICGKSSKDFKQSDFDSYRNTFIGFIFQEYNVMNNFTVKENIALALQLQGKKADDTQIQEILEEVDLSGLGNRKPNELSGGQLQRVAIARALIKHPEIIMADEPTGALDSHTGKQVLDILKKLSKDKLVLIVSHDKEFAKNYADRIIELADGQVISDTSKERAAPARSKNGVSIVENEFINISNVEMLKEEDYQTIMEEIRKHKGEMMISFHKDTNKEMKKINHIAENGEMEVFHDTKEKHIHTKGYDGASISFIKSKLPLKSSLKLALSNLKLKPFRLFMTVLLSVVSFTLFGLSDTMAKYDREVATFHSMKDSQVNYISFGKANRVSSGGYSYDEQVKLNKEDVKTLQKQFPNANITATFSGTNYQTNLDLASQITNVEKLLEGSDSLFYPTQIQGLSTIDENSLKKNGFTLTGNLPKKTNEIVITDVLAKTFETYGFQNVDKNGNVKKADVKNKADLLGKKLNVLINNKAVEFTICGIVDTKIDLSRYETLKNEQEGVMSYYLSSEFDKLLNSSYHTMGYLTPYQLQEITDAYHMYYMQNNGYNASINVEDDYFDVFYYKNEKDVEKDKLLDFRNDGDVYLDYRMFQNVKVDGTRTLQMIIESTLSYEDSEEEQLKTLKEIIKTYQKELEKTQAEMLMYDVSGNETKIDKIAGIYFGDNTLDEEYPVVLKNHMIQKMGFEEEGTGDFVLAPMVDDEQLKNMITYSYTSQNNVRFHLENQVMPMLTTVNSVVDTLRPVFFYVGIGFALFASVLFCNFIATSIANKKREIGILRAVGARGLDVLKIFLNESMIIALINWVFALLATAGAVTFINVYIRKQFGILVTILNFGIIQVLLLLGIALVVAFIASALPVFHISRKKPIDAIKDRK